MTELQIVLGVNYNLRPENNVRTMTFSEGYTGNKAWDIEQEVEFWESWDSGTRVRIVLPEPRELMVGMTFAEIVHLGMFLQIRGAGNTYRNQGFRYLPETPTPSGLTMKHPSLIGSPAPAALLVGDRHHPSVEGSYLAAFGPWRGSGVTMLETFTEEEWSRYALANAGEDDMGGLWSELGEPPVVALGRNAQNYCKRQGVPHGVVPHPQYFRRFLSKRGAGRYSRLIQEVIETQEDRGNWNGEL